MEEAKQRDLFCIKCKLQFGKKISFDLHLSLVHGKKVEIKTEAKSNLSESKYMKILPQQKAMVKTTLMNVKFVKKN